MSYFVSVCVYGVYKEGRGSNKKQLGIWEGEGRGLIINNDNSNNVKRSSNNKHSVGQFLCEWFGVVVVEGEKDRETQLISVNWWWGKNIGDF